MANPNAVIKNLMRVGPPLPPGQKKKPKPRDVYPNIPGIQRHYNPKDRRRYGGPDTLGKHYIA